jgi:heme-degrading monooxygenase HmoA
VEDHHSAGRVGDPATRVAERLARRRRRAVRRDQQARDEDTRAAPREAHWDKVACAWSTRRAQYEEAGGFKGFALLLDKSRGEGLGISFWEDEGAMRASDSLGDQAREGAAAAGSGSDRGKEYYEVVIDTMT